MLFKKINLVPLARPPPLPNIPLSIPSTSTPTLLYPPPPHPSLVSYYLNMYYRGRFYRRDTVGSNT